MKKEQVTPDNIRNGLMHNVHIMLTESIGRVFVADYDITKSSMLTNYIIQEVGIDNFYVIIKPAPSNVEFDIKPVRDNFPEIPCDHLLIIASYNKLSVLMDLHKRLNKEVTLLEDNSHILIEEEISLPFVHAVHMAGLIS